MLFCPHFLWLMIIIGKQCALHVFFCILISFYLYFSGQVSVISLMWFEPNPGFLKEWDSLKKKEREGIVYLYDCSQTTFLCQDQDISYLVCLFFPFFSFTVLFSLSHTAWKTISYHAVFMLTSPSSLAAVVDICSRILQSFPVHALYGVNLIFVNSGSGRMFLALMS